MRRTARRGAVASAMLALWASAPAAADEVADFYKRQTVSIVVAHEVGTGFDIYARVLARHLPRHFPSLHAPARLRGEGPAFEHRDLPGLRLH